MSDLHNVLCGRHRNLSRVYTEGISMAPSTSGFYYRLLRCTSCESRRPNRAAAIGRRTSSARDQGQCLNKRSEGVVACSAATRYALGSGSQTINIVWPAYQRALTDHRNNQTGARGSLASPVTQSSVAAPVLPTAHRCAGLTAVIWSVRFTRALSFDCRRKR